MDEQPYSQRELRTHFEGVNSQLLEIVTQVKKTNGSVISLRLWKNYLAGGLAMLGLSIPIVATLINIQMSTQQKITQVQIDSIQKSMEDKIKSSTVSAVAEALAPYKINVNN
jgi:hypothetical protein